jgi:PAS domain S-box-containing protein
MTASTAMELAEHAAQSIVLYDLQGLLTYANPASQSAYGEDESGLLGRHFSTLLAEDNGAAAIWTAILSDGSWSGMLRRGLPDGRQTLADVRLILRRDAAGRPVDVAEYGMPAALSQKGMPQMDERLRLLKAELCEAARHSALGEVSASIAHEVKQPLSAILMNAQTCLRYLDKPNVDLGKVRQLTTRIVDSAQRAGSIVGGRHDLLGRRRPTQTSLSLNDVVRDGTLLLRDETAAKAVRVSLSLDPRLPDIVGDRVQLQQIIVNLIVNGLEAMSATLGRRAIFLTTSFHQNKGVLLSVRDTGHGIDESHLDRIFESFFSTKDGGLGLGLAICRSIAAAHGGSITAENHPDGGAAFHLSLPAVTAA